MTRRAARLQRIALKRAGRAARFPRLGSHQLQRLEARVAVLADDEVVVHGDAQRARDLDDRPRHVDVGARGGGSPEGWLCTRMTAVAESSSARLTTSRG